jgi:hypothetical protein
MTAAGHSNSPFGASPDQLPLGKFGLPFCTICESAIQSMGKLSDYFFME